MIQTLEYLPVPGSFDSDTARTLQLCSQAERLRSTRQVRQKEAAASDVGSCPGDEAHPGPKPRSLPRYTPIMVLEAIAQRGISELQSQTILAGKVQNMKPLLLREAAMRFGICDFLAIVRQRILSIWGPYLTERILESAETFAGKVQIEVYNTVANFNQFFQRLLEVQKYFCLVSNLVMANELPSLITYGFV